MNDEPNDLWNGFLLEFPGGRPDMSAPSGERPKRAVAKAKSAEDAVRRAARLGLGHADVIDSGPHILEQAEKLRVRDGDLELLS